LGAHHALTSQRARAVFAISLGRTFVLSSLHTGISWSDQRGRRSEDLKYSGELALFWIADVYTGLFGRIRLEVQGERADVALEEPGLAFSNAAILCGSIQLICE